MKRISYKCIIKTGILLVIGGTLITYWDAKFHSAINFYLLPAILIIFGWGGIFLKDIMERYFISGSRNAAKTSKKHVLLKKHILLFLLLLISMNYSISTLIGKSSRNKIMKNSPSQIVTAKVVAFRNGYRWDGPKPYVLLRYPVDGQSKPLKKVWYNMNFSMGDSIRIKVFKQNPKIISVISE